MAEKIVVLNSGGFDSVTLLHDIRFNSDPSTEIHSLFFDYGQRSVEQEKHCSMIVAHKLNCVPHIIELPTFSWTHSNFFTEGYESAESQYLEYRNLIFLSYALSLAQSIGANKIYLALLFPNWGYTDTTPEFLQCVNNLAQLSGISVEAPHMQYTKEDTLYLAYKYGVCAGEWHSCDSPKNGHPCGECLDCQALIGYDDYLSPTLNRAMTADDKLYSELHLREAIVNSKLKHLTIELPTTHKKHKFIDEYIYPTIDQSVQLGAKEICLSNFPLYGKSQKYLDMISYIEHYYPEVAVSIAVTDMAETTKKEIVNVENLNVIYDIHTDSNTHHNWDNHPISALKSMGCDVTVRFFIGEHLPTSIRENDYLSILHSDYHIDKFIVEWETDRAVNLDVIDDLFNFGAEHSETLDSIVVKIPSEFIPYLSKSWKQAIENNREYGGTLIDNVFYMDVEYAYPDFVESVVVHMDNYYVSGEKLVFKKPPYSLVHHSLKEILNGIGRGTNIDANLKRASNWRNRL